MLITAIGFGCGLYHRLHDCSNGSNTGMVVKSVFEVLASPFLNLFYYHEEDN